MQDAHAAKVDAPQHVRLVAFDVGPRLAYFADDEGRLLARAREAEGGLGPWQMLHRNTAEQLLMTGHRVTFPYHFEDLRLAKAPRCQ